MTPTPTQEVTLGELWLGGDWACAHGNFGGLRYIAQQLANYVSEPLRCELAELAAACNCDPDRAAALWNGLKNQLHRSASA